MQPTYTFLNSLISTVSSNLLIIRNSGYLSNFLYMPKEFIFVILKKWIINHHGLVYKIGEKL